MAFNYAEFITNNLLSGFDNGSFTEEQVNIFSINYLSKGQISQSDFDAIQEHLYPTIQDDEE